MFYRLRKRLAKRFAVLILFSGSILSFSSINSEELNIMTIDEYIKDNIKDDYKHFGLARFYGATNIFVLQNNSLIKVKKNLHMVDPDSKLIISGRYKAFILDQEVSKISAINQKIVFHDNNEISKNFSGNLLIKSELTAEDGALYELKYSHLWGPLRALCNIIESLFINLNRIFTQNWGMSIIFLAFIFKLLSLPIDLMLQRSKQEVNNIKSKILPLLDSVKTSKDGAEAKHYAYMKIHKEAGASLFYELKPLIYLMLPIPFLIAIFNVLGESYQLFGQSFWWIQNLGYPDSIYKLPFAIPFLGESIHLLPILMLLVSFFMPSAQYNPSSDSILKNKQRVNSFLIGVLFLILFYPFPASLFLFWIFANIFGYFFQRIIKHG